MTTEVAQATTIGAIRIQAPTSSPTSWPLGPVVLLEASARHRQDLALAHLCLRLVAERGFTCLRDCWCHLHEWSAPDSRTGSGSAWSRLRGLTASCGEPAPSRRWRTRRNGWTAAGTGPGSEQATNNWRAACYSPLKTSMRLTSPPSMASAPQPLPATPWSRWDRSWSSNPMPTD